MGWSRCAARKEWWSRERGLTWVGYLVEREREPHSGKNRKNKYLDILLLVYYPPSTIFLLQERPLILYSSQIYQHILSATLPYPTLPLATHLPSEQWYFGYARK
jgi:hypothetical protein